MEYKTHTSLHYSGMYTSSYTLYASRGSKCAPSCFDFPGLLNIESYGSTRWGLFLDVVDSDLRVKLT